MRFIRTSREYHEVYAKHRKGHGALFIFLYQQEEELLEPAVGIIASRKVGKAVIRNKVKRRVKAYLREHLDEIPAGKLVIIARESAGRSDWKGVSEDLGRNLRALEKK